ncbi:MAG TPA: cbb3-type cytochrome oxidase assembly protein CcoS [Sulfurospirillum sp. UBA11407]|jgi:cbb3-type cytochrome oxidase maturation protein|nr:MAG TPA: cbb3-type cytochrome oxidase assembly protein CcoS [Sulfurospirillum sp. UBA11407]DAB34863.1 MAG TPA: cbb3-type cytochrome oxidase assembly protein CcoS [Sulfurospirillum sp. UBA12182]
MDNWVIAMMLTVSTILGALGLWALLWGLKSGQFDDSKKFLDGAQFDSEEALQDALELEKKKKEILEKKRKDGGYAPPD